MSRIYNLTEEQLDFISFMKKRTASFPELNDRLNACLKALPIIESEKLSVSTPETIGHHSPLKMIEFLSLFSKDDDFKWFTHRWDQQRVTLENLISSQNSKKGILSKMVYDSPTPVNELTFYQVWNFINFNTNPEKNYWTDNRGQHHKVGWHSIIDLSRHNPGLPIEKLKLTDGHLFKDYISLFKSSIEFRTDLDENDRFSEFIRATIRKFINGAVTIKYAEDFDDTGYDISIYCDVVGLHFALQTICSWIVQHKVDGYVVSIRLQAVNNGYELVIFQEGSYFSNLKKLEKPSGDFASLRNRLFSVCDFKMIGDYKINRRDTGSIIIYALDNDTKKINKRLLQQCRIEHQEEIIGGVKYILKFYK